MSIRPFAIVLVAALGLAGAGPGGSKTVPPTIRTQPTFFITGHGWGHGLGMGQYGAYGYAQHGWTYDRIIKHYYTGTTIGQAPVSRIRVLLVDSAKQVTISSKLPFQVVDATGSKHALNAGSLTVGPGYKYTDPTNLQAKPTVLPYPLEFRAGATALALNGRGYRGSLRVLKLSATKVRIVNVVDLDLYLRGVVPSEMPKSWAPEALKAQAVAARSYALSHLHPSNGGFDLYSDTRDQVYLGIPHEAPSTTAAVNATAGQVALYKGKVASTYFFSTSGGERRPSRISIRTRPRFPISSPFRTLRHDLAVPRLGAVPVHGAEARPRPQVARQAARRPDRRRLVRPGAERRRDRLEGPGDGDRERGSLRTWAPVDLVPGRRARPRRPVDPAHVRHEDRAERDRSRLHFGSAAAARFLTAGRRSRRSLRAAGRWLRK